VFLNEGSLKNKLPYKKITQALIVSFDNTAWKSHFI
jgi:hypothetical protein